MLVRVGSLESGIRLCVHCGSPFHSENVRVRHCSTLCRRQFQNERRKRERAEEARRIVLPVQFCSVCGRPFQRKRMDTEDEGGVLCGPCCRRIAHTRKGLCLPPARHKPNIALALAFYPQRDPWESNELPEEVTTNSLHDEGMGMPEEIDDIEYYRLKIASLYNAGRPKDETPQEAVPSPAESEEPKEQKRVKRWRSHLR